MFEEVETEKSAEDELDALRVQGDKAWVRYARKAEGRALVQKVRASLYQKGFANELINTYIEEKELNDE